MSAIDKHVPGSFCWPELGTTDTAAAKTFYSRLFGWATEDLPMGEGITYTILKLEGRRVWSGPWTDRAERILGRKREVGIDFNGQVVGVDHHEVVAHPLHLGELEPHISAPAVSSSGAVTASSR